MDAIDLALQEQAAAARKRPAAMPSAVGADGEPVDKPSDANAATRMSAWRAWARRREAADGLPSMGLVPRPGGADGATSGG